MKLQTSIQIERLKAEIGTPGARNTGNGNLVEPQPKNNVPSLKSKDRKRAPTDEEIEKLEEEVMPDQAKSRKKYRQERIGKSGGLQTW